MAFTGNSHHNPEALIHLSPLMAHRAFSRPLPTHDQSLSLLAQYRATGDERYRSELIEAHVRLITSIAKAHWRPQYSINELFQASAEGFIKGLDRFEPERGVKIMTYCTNWCRKFVLLHIEQHSYQVKYGSRGKRIVHGKELRGNIERLQQEHELNDVPLYLALPHKSARVLDEVNAISAGSITPEAYLFSRDLDELAQTAEPEGINNPHAHASRKHPSEIATNPDYTHERQEARELDGAYQIRLTGAQEAVRQCIKHHRPEYQEAVLKYYELNAKEYAELLNKYGISNAMANRLRREMIGNVRIFLASTPTHTQKQQSGNYQSVG